MPSLARYLKLMALALSLILILTGAAQNDHRPPSADRRPPSLPSARFASPLHPFVSSPFHLFSSSSPTDNGTELYQFWCSTCHGDRGQGLTPEWRATWPKGKQNCWQSKCHATNHPPEGFVFPKNVPALIGPDTLTKFRTAQDLYGYSRATMPYWSPNLLKDDEYRAITAFLVKANYAAQGVPLPTSLSGDWTVVSLHPGTIGGESLAGGTTVVSPTSETSSEIQPPGPIVSPPKSFWPRVIVVIVGSGLVVWFTRRFLFPMNKKG